MRRIEKLEDKKPRRICVFCESWGSGGIESFLCNVLKHMNLDGLEINIAVSQLKNSIFLEQLKDLGIHFHELSGNQKRLIKNYKMFQKILKENRCDVVHLNVFHALSLVYGAIAKYNKVPRRIVHSHNSALRRSFSRLFKNLLHGACKYIFFGTFTDHWACSCKAAEFMFPRKKAAGQKYLFIPNGVDIKRFSFDEKKRLSFREKFKVGDKLMLVNIGRLSGQKNQSFLLDVAYVLKKRHVDFVLFLFGEGDKLCELKAKAGKLEIVNNVVFGGTTPEVPNVLSAADVFMLPSLFEGLAISAVEAQAAGLPVICSEYISKEIFVTKTVFAVPLDKEKWADSVLNISENSGRNAEAGEQLRKKGFDIEYTASLIENAYRGLKQDE